MEEEAISQTLSRSFLKHPSVTEEVSDCDVHWSIIACGRMGRVALQPNATSIVDHPDDSPTDRGGKVAKDTLPTGLYGWFSLKTAGDIGNV